MAKFLNIKLCLAMLLAVGSGAVLVSGGTAVDPPVPRGFPGVVPAFFEEERSGREGRGEEWVAIRRDWRWLSRARPLSDGAPAWARSMYRRSLLVQRAFVDRETGAAVAGAAPGWAYVWPRDAAAVAIALASAGYRLEARRIVRFLRGLDLDSAARFDSTGAPVPGRDAQGDAAGWVAAATRAAGLSARPQAGADAIEDRRIIPAPSVAWRGPADYQEKDGGDFLGNAIGSGLESGLIRRAFVTPRGLARVAGEPESGLDTAAAWAVRPFPLPALFPAVRRTLLRLVAERESRFGLLPSEDWDGGEDPWTAPTAWTAWSLATLSRNGASAPAADRGNRSRANRDRRAALALMADLRRAATPLGLLPERVDVQSGRPTSTTPLAWSHAFAILAIRELWPVR
jgi:glucoamylase